MFYTHICAYKLLVKERLRCHVAKRLANLFSVDYDICFSCYFIDVAKSADHQRAD